MRPSDIETPPARPEGTRRRTIGGTAPRGTLAAGLVALLVAVTPACAQQQAGAAVQAPPAQFRGIALGMAIDQVKAALKVDPLFRYRGDPDVSFLPQSSQFLIECEGSSWIRRAYFQFADSRLYIMILVLDTQKLDHYSMFTALSAKYGPPVSLSPTESVWDSDPVRFSLERPLTVKYLDNKTFKALLEKSTLPASIDQLSRDGFLGQF
jgi:hypothetical protein